MRYAIILTSMLLGAALPANAEVSIAIGVPGLSIGINMPVYPQYQRVPNYPVYYAPQSGFNLFFYDGMYWAYQDDNWYASSWYNGPWGMVSPRYVPVYVLRVPVRYYQRPPPYFRGWSKNQPPRWGQYYGKHWEQERHGWDSWNHKSAPPPAPLPVYQQHYSGDRYPRYEQQPAIRSQNYHYQPSDPVVRQHYQQEDVQARHYSQAQQHQHEQQQAQSKQQHEQQQAQSKQQHEQQQHGSSSGEAQSSASGQENAPQGKGATKKGSKSGQGQDDSDDEGHDKGQGHGG